MDLYREQILEHWQNPQNFGVMDKPDVIIEQVNPLCGDEVTFFFRLGHKPNNYSSSRRREVTTKNIISAASKAGSDISEERNWHESKIVPRRSADINSRVSSRYARTIISDVRFTGSGCAISMASASMLSEAIKGRSVKEIEKITGQDVLGLIGGNVGPARLKCAFLALEAVRKLTTDN